MSIDFHYREMPYISKTMQFKTMPLRRKIIEKIMDGMFSSLSNVDFQIGSISAYKLLNNTDIHCTLTLVDSM